MLDYILLFGSYLMIYFNLLQLLGSFYFILTYGIDTVLTLCTFKSTCYDKFSSVGILYFYELH